MEENNKLELVIDDGLITVPVKNTDGEQIGQFRFRPTDINIVKRYNEVSDKFPEIVKPLVDANIENNGVGSDAESIKILEQVEANLYELVDYLFDGNMAEAFFGKVNPFSLIDGKFYCENVLSAVGAFISKRFDAEIKKISSRVEKHLHGYRTGKHKDGK